MEPGFADTPGQWGLIWLSQGSINNEINHLTLKNATVGLFVSSVENTTSTTLKINNSQIYNSANVGILARTAKIEGSNLVINSAGQASLACTEGGDYSFKHCTFNNNWQSSKQVAVLISNYKTIDEVITTLTLNKAEFDNCIIYGSNQVEVLLDKKTGSPFNYEFNNCLVKFNDSGTNLSGNALYDVIRNQQNGIIKNKDPKFFSINQNLLNIDSTSPAVAKGSATYLIPTDILGVTRTLPPDIGAYQNAPFPE